MSLPPVIFIAGKQKTAIRNVIYLLAYLLLGAACAVAVVNSALPRLFGIAPILSIPEVLQTIANVLAYLTAVAAMILLMIFLLGMWESHLAARRFTDFRRLISLPDLLSSQLTIAPNLAESERDMIIKAIQQLAVQRGISSIIAPATVGDIQDGSVDRLFVTTTQSATDFRRMVRCLKCDDVSRVPAGSVRQLTKQAQFGKGTVWLLTWD